MVPADIAFPVAGPVGLGSLEVAKERDLMFIGVDTDWYVSAGPSNVILTSVEKKMGVAVFDAIKASMDGTFKGCDVYVGTLSNGGVDIAPLHDFESRVPQWLKDELEQVGQGIINGTIETGWD